MSDLHERTKEHPSARQIEGVSSSIMSIPRISLLLYKVDQKLHNILVIFVSLQQSPLSNMKQTFIVFGEWRFVFQCQKYCIALLNVLYYCIHWRLFMQINWWQKMMANSHAWIVLNFACESAPTAPIRNRNLRSVHKCKKWTQMDPVSKGRLKLFKLVYHKTALMAYFSTGKWLWWISLNHAKRFPSGKCMNVVHHSVRAPVADDCLWGKNIAGWGLWNVKVLDK